MRRIGLFCLGLFWLACSAAPRISTVSTPVTLSKGLKPLGTLDLSQLGQRGLKSPSAIAVDPSGNIYIADTDNDRILKFSPTGVLLKSQGGFGWDGGQFNRPTGLCLDRGLNLYVADSQNKRAQLFDLNLNFVSAIQPPETLDFHGLGAVYDVAVSASGELYISDTWNDWILQTDNFYAFKGKIGSFEAGEGRLTDPFGLATDSRGNLYAADAGNKRVAVFDPFGNFRHSIGAGLLSKPSDVSAVGGEIMVCDLELSQVFCFDQQGELVWQSGSQGDQNGQFREPCGLAVHESRLYVVEKGNNQVQIFEIVR